MKAKARVTITIIREGSQHARINPCKGKRPQLGKDKWNIGGIKWDMVPWDGISKKEIRESGNLG